MICEVSYTLNKINWPREPVVVHVEPFSETEITTAAKSIKSEKSPGLDGISPETVKFTANCIPNLIQDRLNKLLHLQEFPESEKTVK